jgi:hypothetical protein
MHTDIRTPIHLQYVAKTFHPIWASGNEFNVIHEEVAEVHTYDCKTVVYTSTQNLSQTKVATNYILFF